MPDTTDLSSQPSPGGTRSKQHMFPLLDDDDLRQIEPLATCESFEDGGVVLPAGTRDVDLIVIERGSVDVLRPATRTVIATHAAGNFVGDIDLLTRRPILYEVVARGDGAGGPTRVLRVPGAKLRHLLNAVPRLSEKILVAIQARRHALADDGISGVRVVGPGGCGQTNLIREFLHKNFVPFNWIDSETPEGAAAIEAMGDRVPAGSSHAPIVDCDGTGPVMRGPTLHQVAECAHVWRGCPTGEVDFAIVGAGPAGIAAAVYAASEGLSTIVLDQLGPGGQAGGSSRIENFIGFPSGLSGTDLATRGVLQMLKFGAQMIAPVGVERIDPAPGDGTPHVMHLSCGVTVRARTILAATGVTWRRLQAENADRFERAGIYYACTAVEAMLHDNCDVAVVGGGNSAGQAVMFLAEQCRHRTVHLLVRRPLGQGMSDYLSNRIRETANVKVHEGVQITAVRGERRIDTIELATLKDASRPPITLSCRAVFVFIGAEPRSDWLPTTVARDPLGYVLTGSDVVAAGKWPLTDRSPCPLETSVPGILAGGDLRAGSTKRVGFAVGDGSLAVTCAHRLRQ